jgi:hypothetical protein
MPYCLMRREIRLFLLIEKMETSFDYFLLYL